MGNGTPDRWRGLKVGVATYSLRKMTVEQAIAAIRRVGLGYASLKDVHFPRTSAAADRAEIVRRFAEGGVTVLSCGVVTLRNDAADIRDACRYAKEAGIPTLVCSPDPASLPLLDHAVREFDLRLAIHNHGPGDRRFPTPQDAADAVQKYDRRIGLCIDIGHTARAGVDPARAIRRHRERLYDLHWKDLDRLSANGRPIECGRGALDLPAVLNALLEIRYPHLIGFEHEKDADDPLPGLAESVGHLRGLLDARRT